MNFVVLFFMFSTSAFAQISSVSQGSAIEAAKINEVIQKTNDLSTAKKIQHAFPVGTILTSILNLNQFQSINGDCWRLMDGSSLTGTDLRELTAMSNLPNTVANGEFLRQAKDGRALGSGEMDAQQNITGQFAFTDNDATSQRVRVGEATGSFGTVNGTGSASLSGGSYSGGVAVNIDTSRQVRTADEVRPKNIAVNMFIKVNNQCN